MGCSASKLSSTRSGTVRPAFLLSRFLAAGFLFADTSGLSLAAPVPPLALLGGKQRIARLGHRSREHVLAADIDMLAGSAAEFLIKLCWILAGKLLYAADAEKLKVAEHGWSHRN